MTNTDDKRLTLKEAAERLQVSTKTVLRLVGNGSLTAIQVGASSKAKTPTYRFRMQDILAFEESRLTRHEPVRSRVRRQKPPQIIK